MSSKYKKMIVLVDALNSMALTLIGAKSKMVCINGVKKERRWNIGEVDEYKYPGVTVSEYMFECFKEYGG